MIRRLWLVLSLGWAAWILFIVYLAHDETWTNAHYWECYAIAAGPFLLGRILRLIVLGPISTRTHLQ